MIDVDEVEALRPPGEGAPGPARVCPLPNLGPLEASGPPGSAELGSRGAFGRPTPQPAVIYDGVMLLGTLQAAAAKSSMLRRIVEVVARILVERRRYVASGLRRALRPSRGSAAPATTLSCSPWAMSTRHLELVRETDRRNSPKIDIAFAGYLGPPLAEIARCGEAFAIIPQLCRQVAHSGVADGAAILFRIADAPHSAA